MKAPAEVGLLESMKTIEPRIKAAVSRSDYKQAFQAIETLRGPVAQFFDDVLVMADEEKLRTARLALVASLRDLILDIADISEIAPEAV